MLQYPTTAATAAKLVTAPSAISHTRSGRRRIKSKPTMKKEERSRKDVKWEKDDDDDWTG